MATPITPQKIDIYEEDIPYRSALSEELFRKFGASINAINKGSLLPIGSQQMSGLPLAQFRSLFDSSWVLMDGSNITSTDLGQFMLAQGLASGNVFIPDMRGQVPIGVNNGRADGKQNLVVPGLGLGQQMGDGVKNHTHGYEKLDYAYSAPGIFYDNQYTSNFATNTGQSHFNAGGQTQNTVNSVGVNWYIKVWHFPPA